MSQMSHSKQDNSLPLRNKVTWCYGPVVTCIRVFRPYLYYIDDRQLLGRLYWYPTVHNTSSSRRTNEHCLSRFILLSPEIFRYTYRSGCSSRSLVLFTCISTTTQTSSTGTFLFFPESPNHALAQVGSFIYLIASITYPTTIEQRGTSSNIR